LQNRQSVSAGQQQRGLLPSSNKFLRVFGVAAQAAPQFIHNFVVGEPEVRGLETLLQHRRPGKQGQ